MSETRSPYRVHFGGGLGSQSIRLHVPSHAPLDGHLIDVSAHGASIIVPRADLSMRDLNQVLEMEFVGGAFPDPVRTMTKIVYANEEGKYLRCGLQFASPESLQNLLSPELQAMFNRRSEVRLQFGKDSPANVFLELPGGRGVERGKLFDLSPSGICVYFDHRIRGFEEGKPATSYFTLPGEWRQLVFRVLLRNSRATEGGMLLGMEFGMRESTAYRKRREIIEEYLGRFLVEATV